MGLPKNKDAVITSCFNCDLEFETKQKLGDWITCQEDEGGCGFEFKLIARNRHLETDEE